MSINAKWDTKEIEDWLGKLKGISEEDIQRLNEDTIKEIAARTLAKIIARTPVGQYPASSGKVGGTLRRGWTAEEDIDPYTFIMANSEVIKKGDTYTIIISNNVFYSPFVEYGHRTVNGGWVDGQFMMTISMEEMQEELPAIMEKKMKDFLGEYLG
ncbi:MAG: HK97 gp10 family phage protein [Epulopiscium sp.]|nr:HK97 gp10 family phage protein [Candidatus Epulonipiscium sp.]